MNSRYPLWNEANNPQVQLLETYLERRETLGTTTVDAVPEMRVPLPSNSMVPFITAIMVILTLLGTLFHVEFVAVGLVLVLIMLGIWHWPRKHEWSMDWTKAGPEDALPVSTVVQDKHPPYYYGTILMILIEAVEFGALIASYFYLRSTTNDWPPGDTPLPQLLLPTIATLILVASVIPTHLADKAVKKNDQRKLVFYTALTALMDLVFSVMFIAHLAFLNYKWTHNAYASAYWTLIGSHLIFMGIMILENLYILVLAIRGFFNSERHAAIEVDGLSSYFVVALWIAIYLTVFISPYVL